MTWSILARDADGRFGIAIASRFFSVGSLCIHSQAGVGALATQALMNPLYGPQGLALLAQGLSAQAVVSALTGADAGQAQRQLHVLPAQGPGAAHTGSACVDWCGHLLHADVSVAGKMLAGPRVIEATADMLTVQAWGYHDGGFTPGPMRVSLPRRGTAPPHDPAGAMPGVG